jgi:predicted nucleic-acid-binding protein
LQSLTPENPGFISLVSLAELVLVLRRQYRLDKAQLIECLQRLLDSPELVVESQTAVTQALRKYSNSKVDLADCIIERSGHLAGCSTTYTFDVQASKFAGMRLL